MIFLIFTNSRGLSSFHFCSYPFWEDGSGTRRTRAHGNEGWNRHAGRGGEGEGGGGGGIGISSLPRKRKYRYLSGMYAFVLRVTSAPFKYHQWLRELPLPLTVLAVRVRVGSRVERRDGNEMGTSDRGARERTRRVARVSHPIIVGYESTEPATRPSAAVLLEVLWTAADGSGSQRTNNIVYFSDGSHRRSALQFAPRGWGCMIHDVGDTGPYFDPSFHSSCFLLCLRPSRLRPALIPPIDVARSWTLCTIYLFPIPPSFPPLPCLRWRECRFQQYYPTAGLADPFSLTNFPPRIVGLPHKLQGLIRFTSNAILLFKHV